MGNGDMIFIEFEPTDIDLEEIMECPGEGDCSTLNDQRMVFMRLNAA